MGTNEVGLVDWSKLPDVVVVALLTVAFASVAKSGRKSISSVWLIGWLLIVLHFFAFMFLPAPGHWSDLANFVGMAALACAGVLFMWASVPFRGLNLKPLDACRASGNQYALSWPCSLRSRCILGSGSGCGALRGSAARYRAPGAAPRSVIRSAGPWSPSTRPSRSFS